MLLGIIVLSSVAFAQAPRRYESMLSLVEQRNTSLRMLQNQMQAERIESHAQGLVDDPEVEFAYYSGSPSEIGKRWDLNVSQSFEVPSVYIRKMAINNIQDSQAVLNYLIQRSHILLETQTACADLIYHSAIQELYDKLNSNAYSIARLYEKRYKAGDCSILDYNRAQMNWTKTQNDCVIAGLTRDHDLHTLNNLSDTDYCPMQQTCYDTVVLSDNFNDWWVEYVISSPEMALVNTRYESAANALALSKAEWLPKFSVGYSSENVVGQTFRGAALGMTIPIWNNRNKVNLAQQRLTTTQSARDAVDQQSYSEYQCMFHRAKALEVNIDRLKTDFNRFDSTELLLKALNAGEITLEEYLREIAYYTELQLSLLENQHMLELLVLQLNAHKN